MLRAVRGAITVPEDTTDAIRESTGELLAAVLARNLLGPEDIVSIILTATPDLVADFPAVAARGMGLAHVPLLCASEIAVVGAMARCIRVLVHCYVPPERPIRHAYLREARRLRTDLAE